MEPALPEAGSDVPSTAGVQADEDGMRLLLDRPLSQSDLEANTRTVAAKSVPEERNATGIVVARLGPERLALPVAIARRVVPVARIHHVPHRANPVFAGICAVGGELLLAARLDRLLGIERDASNDPAHRMIVVGVVGHSWALTVDLIEGTRRVPRSALLPAPATVSRALDGITQALVRLDDGPLVALLDGERLMRSLDRSVT